MEFNQSFQSEMFLSCVLYIPVAFPGTLILQSPQDLLLFFLLRQTSNQGSK